LVSQEAEKWPPVLNKIKEIYGAATVKLAPHSELVKYLESLYVAEEEERKRGDPQSREPRLVLRDIARLKDLSSDVDLKHRT
jgi:hypothetical protein